jgi:phage shock protein PspC (stress-responsive transcriptional regulator)
MAGLGYILAIVAFIMMMKNYRSTNWLWLGFLVASLFFGVALFVSLAYFITALTTNNSSGRPKNGTVVYSPDGSYTVYNANQAQGPSPGRVAFRVVGGVIAGVAVSFGLLIVGIILLFTMAPDVACGGNSKGCY